MSLGASAFFFVLFCFFLKKRYKSDESFKRRSKRLGCFVITRIRNRFGVRFGAGFWVRVRARITTTEGR